MEGLHPERAEPGPERAEPGPGRERGVAVVVPLWVESVRSIGRHPSTAQSLGSQRDRRTRLQGDWP